MVQKIFFPVSVDEFLEKRIIAALKITLYFNAHLEILYPEININSVFPEDLIDMDEVIDKMLTITQKSSALRIKKIQDILKSHCDSMNIKFSDKNIKNKPSVSLVKQVGTQAKLVAQMSKFCDLVLATTPKSSRQTSMLEMLILSSPKPLLILPKKPQSFNMERILIAYNNSLESARAINSAILFLKKAKKVHILAVKEPKFDSVFMCKKLVEYLEFHDIVCDFSIIFPKESNAQALVDYAIENEYDMIVAGAFSKKGAIERVLGGSTDMLLQNAKVPILMSN